MFLVLQIYGIARHIDSVKVIVIVTSDKCYDNHKMEHFEEEDALGGKDILR